MPYFVVAPGEFTPLDVSVAPHHQHRNRAFVLLNYSTVSTNCRLQSQFRLNAVRSYSLSSASPIVLPCPHKVRSYVHSYSSTVPPFLRLDGIYRHSCLLLQLLFICICSLPLVLLGFVHRSFVPFSSNLSLFAFGFCRRLPCNIFFYDSYQHVAEILPNGFWLR